MAISSLIQPNNLIHSLPVHRFSVDAYHRMIEGGILTEDDRVELLDGWIVSKMPHKPSHDSSIDLLVGELQPLLPADWFIRIQSAVTLDASEPEPDLAVVKGPRGRYASRHPGVDDIGLLVDVSDTTLPSDRDTKGPLYAKAGVANYWIADLKDKRLFVYSNPTGPSENPVYQKMEIVSASERVAVVISGEGCGEIELSKIFGEKTES